MMKTENPEGRFRDINIVQSYFNTLLHYMLSVTFCGAAVM